MGRIGPSLQKRFHDLWEAIYQEIADRKAGDTALWNSLNKLRQDFDTHNADNVRHVTQSDKDRWNAKIGPDSGGGGGVDLSSINALIKHSYLYIADVGENKYVATSRAVVANSVLYSKGSSISSDGRKEVLVSQNAGAVFLVPSDTDTLYITIGCRLPLWQNMSVENGENIAVYTQTYQVHGMPDTDYIADEYGTIFSYDYAGYAGHHLRGIFFRELRFKSLGTGFMAGQSIGVDLHVEGTAFLTNFKNYDKIPYRGSYSVIAPDIEFDTITDIDLFRSMCKISTSQILSVY